MKSLRTAPPCRVIHSVGSNASSGGMNSQRSHMVELQTFGPIAGQRQAGLPPDLLAPFFGYSMR